MMMFQWNAEEARKVQEEERQEDIREAESRGEAKGKAEGVAIATATIIRNMLNTTNLSYEQIAQIGNTTIEEVRRIAKDAGIQH